MAKKKSKNWDYSKPISNLQVRIAKAKRKWQDSYAKQLEYSLSKHKAK
jgi:hypothetical protein